MQRSKQLLPRSTLAHREPPLEKGTISPSYRRLAAAVPLSFTLPAGCREVPRPIRRPMVSAPRTWQGRRTLRVDDTE